jgi:DNA-binding NtrC family response regulator
VAAGKLGKTVLNNTNQKILIVDDEKMIRWSLGEALRGWGYQPIEAETASAALAAFDAEAPAAVLLDINLPDGSGLDVLRNIRRRQPDAVVIMITANVLVDETIAALRGGAYDFIGKPINLEELQVAIRNGIEASRLRREVTLFRRERAQQFSFEQIVGQSPAMREMLELAHKVAESEVSSVLLQGESGTGKDLVAKAIHYHSSRANSPFIAINCAALPSTLIESELFGYEKGAFTDAKARKEGLFEQAEGGTLFLDEIGELELSLQAKLLRVLEEGSFRRVGGLKDLPLDVRVIAASNRDLRTEGEAGRFRADLFYRLAVIQIDIPPLRERGDDVRMLAEHYLASFKERLRKNIDSISEEALESFRNYDWPGNVRELRNVIERAMILEDGEEISAKYLPRTLSDDRGKHPGTSGDAALQANHFRLPPRGVLLEEVEMSLVRQAIERSGGNQTKAAELLGISRDQLRYRLKKLEEARTEATS